MDVLDSDSSRGRRRRIAFRRLPVRARRNGGTFSRLRPGRDHLCVFIHDRLLFRPSQGPYPQSID
jgi:hypothetical protein